MPTSEEQRRLREAHDAAMTAIAGVVQAWQAGGISYETAAKAIDEALAGESARIVRVGHGNHNPEVRS